MSHRPGLCILFSLLMSAIVAGSGCTTMAGADVPAPPPPLSVEEVQGMLTAQQPQPEIVQQIRTRGLVAPASQDDILALGQNGASNEVLEAVAQARIEAPRVGYAPGYASPWPWWPGFGFGIGLGWGGYYGGSGIHHRPHIGPRPGTLGPRPPGQFRGPSSQFRGGGRHR